ncbi:hypothetical protein KDL67_13135 [bacterium]|nr:hypothetical protein [bacterium]
MIVTLVRAHDTLRRFPRLFVVAAAAGGTALGLITWYAATHRMLPERIVLALGWLTLTLLFLGERRSRRGHPWGLTLPIGAGRLWASHLLTQLLAGTLLLGLVFGLAALGSGLLHRAAPGRIETAPLGPPLVLELFACLLLFLGLREFTAGRTLRPPARRAGLLADLGGALLVLLLLVSPLPQRWATLLMLSGAALTLGIAWRRLPPSLLLADTALEPARSATPYAPRRPLGGHGLLLARTLLRQTAKNRFALGVGIAFMVLFGVALSGGFPVLEVLRYALGPITVYMFFAMLAGPLMKLGNLAALPIGASRTLLLLMLPSLLSPLAGYGLATVAGRQVGPREALPRLVERDGALRLLTAPGHARIAWDGDVPALADGSSPRSEPLFSGARPRLYWPLDVPAGASRDFAEAQLTRAQAEGRAATPGLPSLLILPWIATLLILAPFLRLFRAEVSERRRRVVFGVILAVLLALHLLLFATVAGGGVSEDVWPELCALAVQAIPGGLAMRWSLALLLLAGSFAFARRSFERAELLPSRGAGDVCL